MQFSLISFQQMGLFKKYAEITAKIQPMIAAEAISSRSRPLGFAIYAGYRNG